MTARRSSPTSAASGCGPVGAGDTRAGRRDREARLRRGVGGRLARRRPGVRRADPGEDRVAAGGHRIVNIWTRRADEVAESYHRIEKAFPGRFLLGVGVGHPEHTQEYRKPYDALVDYLDALDAAKVPTSRRVIAALGPKVLKLSAQRSAGRTSVPDHAGAHRRRRANCSVPTVFLAPEHKVVLTTDAGAGPRDRPRDRRLLPRTCRTT